MRTLLSDPHPEPDALVFGAGPAGLAAAHALIASGIRPTVVDAGLTARLRDRAKPHDLATGVGGAGLFSDGKFSWYPSATRLWQLDDNVSLRRSYDWFVRLLAGLVDAPPFPERKRPSPGAVGGEKRYGSSTADFATRMELIERLARPLGDALIVSSDVSAVSAQAGRLGFELTGPTGRNFLAPAVTVMAGGRFGGLNIDGFRAAVPHAFRRYEFGVRLETVASRFFLKNHPCLDPKLIWSGPEAGHEWRTFCTCRNGEVVATEFNGVVSYSGRSDGPPSEFSNLGFNVRLTTEPEAGSPLAAEMARLMTGKVPSFQAGLREYLAGDAEGYGPIADRLIRDGLTRLTLDNTEAETIVVGPTIEGVGYYPVVDGHLKSPAGAIWFAGDQAGGFRGLTAAFVSGYYAGLQSAQALTSGGLAGTGVRSSVL